MISKNKKLALILAFTFMSQSIGINSTFAASIPKASIGTSDTLVTGNTYSGFKLQSKTFIKDINSTLYQFEHEKTGAKLCYIKNDDNQKRFSITFKALPKDNTGVNHVIEHMLSKQYYSSVIATKNSNTQDSYSTYNATTTNNEYFEDAVNKIFKGIFFPNLSKNLMKEQGWRYEINSPNDDIKINGVVYNEMKGKHSAFDILDSAINKSLFSDSSEFNAGGTPNDIPKLTYNEVLQTYQKYYIPSNSLIYLYGNLDIEKTLKYINDNCLSKLAKSSIQNNSGVSKNGSNKTNYSEVYYSIPKVSSTSNKAYLSMNYALGKDVDAKTKEALSIMQDIISPALKKAFSDNNLGSLVWEGVDANSCETPFSIIATDSNESQKQKFQTVINNTLNTMVKNGIDENLVTSVLNSNEMSSRETSSSSDRGAIYMQNIQDAWSENGNILYSPDSASFINSIAEEYKNNNKYFENLIKKYLLNNANTSIVVASPKPGLDDENDAKLKNDLAKYKASLSTTELANLINENKEFEAWQDANSKNNTETQDINLDSIDKKSKEVIPTVVNKSNGATILKHPAYTDGIEYINLYFDTSKVPQDKLMYLMLLNKLLGQVDTKNYAYSKLSNMITGYTGGISFLAYEPQSFVDIYKSSDNYYPKLEVSMSTLNSNLENSFKILNEVINNSDFSSKLRLKSLIENIKNSMEYNINHDPYSYAGQEVQSHNSDAGKYYNLGYMPFYNFICDLNKNFDAKADDIINNLDSVRNLAFDKNNLIASYTGDNENFNNFTKCFESFSDKIKTNNAAMQKYKFDNSQKNEAFITSAQNQCIEQGGDYTKAGYTSSGKFAVLEAILGNYMQEQIRTKGGAYHVQIDLSGSSIVLCSTSDPNLKETLDTFNNLSSYIKNFNPDKNQMNKYILNTVAHEDDAQPSDPFAKGKYADDMYITGVTEAERQKYRDELLSTTVDDIKSYAPMIDSIIKQNNFCVFGNKNKINENKNLFQSITDLSANK